MPWEDVEYVSALVYSFICEGIVVDECYVWWERRRLAVRDMYIMKLGSYFL